MIPLINIDVDMFNSICKQFAGEVVIDRWHECGRPSAEDDGRYHDYHFESITVGFAGISAINALFTGPTLSIDSTTIHTTPVIDHFKTVILYSKEFRQMQGSC